MIILFYGQPASGKTTLANEFSKIFVNPVLIDGDRWREVTNNKDYSKEGRTRNLKGAFDMALYLEREGFASILSFVTPYTELRSYLYDNADNVYCIYLKYNEDRGRNMNFAKDFEEGFFDLELDTTKYSIEECIDKIKNAMVLKK